MATRCCSFFPNFLQGCSHPTCLHGVACLNIIVTLKCMFVQTHLGSENSRCVSGAFKNAAWSFTCDEKQPKVPLGLYNIWGEYILLERAGERGEGEPSNSFSHAEHGCWTHLSNHRPQNRHIYHRSSTSHPPTEDYKTDTLQTDQRHGMLHHSVAERVRCSGVYLQTPDSLQKLQKPVLSFSAMTDADGCILPGLGEGVRFKIKERDILVFKTRRLKEAPSALASIQPGKKSVFYVLSFNFLTCICCPNMPLL